MLNANGGANTLLPEAGQRSRRGVLHSTEISLPARGENACIFQPGDSTSDGYFATLRLREIVRA